jgi:hypothetical protein
MGERLLPERRGREKGICAGRDLAGNNGERRGAGRDLPNFVNFSFLPGLTSL